MVIYNAATRELTAKIVYYGPGLGGKTTNLQVLHDRLEPSTVGKLLNLSTHTDRTIYFDLLPVELGDIKGYKIRFQLATVPGQTAFNETRRVVLKGADGVVFVADSQWTMLPKNLESWQNLKDNLKSNAVAFEGMPVVIQYNKRDLNDILSIEAMQEALGLSSFPFVEAVASAGRGVTETFKLISKLTFVDLLRRLQGRRPEEAGLAPSKEPAKDDLQSWRQSLFQRAPGPEPKRPRPITPVPSPSEEPPFETGEATATTAPEAGSVVEGPFGISRETGPKSREPEEPPEPLEVVDEVDAPPPATSAAAPKSAPASAVAASAPESVPASLLQELEARIEARLAEVAERVAEGRADVARVDAACNVLASRLEAQEKQSSDRSSDSARALSEARQAFESRLAALDERASADSREIARIGEVAERLGVHEQRLTAGFERLEAQEKRIDGHEKRVESQEKRVEAQEKRVEAQEKHQRALEDDAGMALTELTERIERLQQQLAGFGRTIETLQAALEEKTHQGRREAEDIRTQLSPLLEAHGQRGAADERLLAEVDRLREGLADSLAGLSEQLRRAVRGL